MAAVSGPQNKNELVASWFANRGGHGTGAATGEKKHQQAKREQNDAPIEVDVNAERLLVAGGIADCAVDDQDQSEQRKQSPQWKSNVDAHQRSYQKIIFNSTVPATTIMARE